MRLRYKLKPYKIIRSILFSLEPEFAHEVTLRGLKIFRYSNVPECNDHPLLKIKVFNKEFSNPIGLAAGFDKNAEVIPGIKNLGFGFSEVGTVTPTAQLGNPKPRVFRLIQDEAIINRLGFNSLGHEKLLRNIIKDKDDFIVGVNIGANRDTTKKIIDYIEGIKIFNQDADYITINISSPNTPGLRDFHNNQQLVELLSSIKKQKHSTPVLIKISPDLMDEQIQDVINVCLSHRINGLVVSNTTISREGIINAVHSKEAGGLSGKPLRDRSSQLISEIYPMVKNKMILIGVGGISSGREVFDRISNGASLVQLYTALVYQGPYTIKKIKKELITIMQSNGIKNLKSLVGSAC